MTEEHEHAEVSLAYQDSCSGLAMLLIHGFPLNSAMWGEQIDEMSDLVRVLAPDLRGHGMSEAVAGPYTVEMMADDCAGLLESVGVQDQVVVCGMSMGGYVALEFLRRYPDWVAGLILVSTRASADTDEGKRGRDAMAERAREQGAEAIVDEMLPKMMAPQTYEEQPELVEAVREMMAVTSVEGMAGALAAMRDRPDSTGMLAEVEVPVLVIHGADDQLIPASVAEAMAQAIPDAETAIISDAGHLVNVEQPEEFNRVMWNFLARVKADYEEGSSSQ